MADGSVSMSYWVEFKVVWGRGRFNPRVEEALNQVLACVEDYVRAEGTYEVERPRGWGDEFRRAFQGEETGIKLLDEAWAIGLLTHVSARVPGVPFRARGRGEERRDAWAFRCRDGQVIAERSREGASGTKSERSTALGRLKLRLKLTRRAWPARGVHATATRGDHSLPVYVSSSQRSAPVNSTFGVRANSAEAKIADCVDSTFSKRRV